MQAVAHFKVLSTNVWLDKMMKAFSTDSQSFVPYLNQVRPAWEDLKR